MLVGSRQTNGFSLFNERAADNLRNNGITAHEKLRPVAPPFTTRLDRVRGRRQTYESSGFRVIVVGQRGKAGTTV